MFSVSKVAERPGRNPGLAASRAIRGLISALNNQGGVFALTGHMPNAQMYNQNLGHELTEDGSIVPRGQSAPFPVQAPRKPWTR